MRKKKHSALCSIRLHWFAYYVQQRPQNSKRGRGRFERRQFEREKRRVRERGRFERERERRNQERKKERKQERKKERERERKIGGGSRSCHLLIEALSSCQILLMTHQIPHIVECFSNKEVVVTLWNSPSKSKQHESTTKRSYTHQKLLPYF